MRIEDALLLSALTQMLVNMKHGTCFKCGMWATRGVQENIPNFGKSSWTQAICDRCPVNPDSDFYENPACIVLRPKLAKQANRLLRSEW